MLHLYSALLCIAVHPKALYNHVGGLYAMVYLMINIIVTYKVSLIIHDISMTILKDNETHVTH